jgi:predicted esterase
MAEVAERRIAQEFYLYYDLYIPEGDKEKRPLLIAMHGYGGDKTSMMRLARRINEKDYAIATLQGPHQHIVYPNENSKTLGYGFGWLSNFKPEESVALHHHTVVELINSVSKEFSTGPVFLLGFSQSVALNFRFAFTHPELVSGVIGICGGIPGDWESEGKYLNSNFDVLYIAGEKDEFYSPERLKTNAKALEKRARSVDFEVFDVGHEIPRDAYPLIDRWIAKHAQK